jgi:hypothetical protein
MIRPQQQLPMYDRAMGARARTQHWSRAHLCAPPRTPILNSLLTPHRVVINCFIAIEISVASDLFAKKKCINNHKELSGRHVHGANS